MSANKKLSLTESVKKTIKRLQVWFKARKRWQRWLLTIATIVCGLYACLFITDRLWRPVKNPEFGVSFSVKYAKELGNDWQANLIALLDDMKLRRFRLMTYWEDIEPTPDTYDFKDLDWQMEQVGKRGGKVSLAIGLRQPRWPECHQPEWADKYAYNSPAWRKELFSYMTAVVEHYKNNPALDSYQMENEALNSWGKECPGKAPQELLDAEFALLKKLDPKHPVYISLSDEHGLPINGVTPDGYGMSVYRLTYSTELPVDFYLPFPVPLTFHRARSFVVKLLRDRDTFIHELQVEPWGPRPTVELSIKEQDRSMDIKHIRENILFGRKIGEPVIYMWGGEWWYWRKQTLHDPRPWNTVKAEVEFGKRP